MTNKSDSKSRAAAIDKIINEIESKSANGDYIYRGERKKYPKISSALYREYAKVINVEEFDLMYAEKEMLKIARNHMGDSPVGALEDFIDIMNMNKERMGDTERSMRRYIGADTTETVGWTIAETAEREILTELQHYGGKTNLIDFTTDYFIAIYFACSGDTKEVGRVILLEKDEEIENMIVRPRNPRHRVIAQKSVFLQPPKGYIEVPENYRVSIPACLKQPLLEHLRKFHDISTETIYNDIHGFIRYQNIHQSAYVQFYMGLTSQLRARETKSWEEKHGKYKESIEHYNEAINLNPDIDQAYCNRGECHLHLQEWEKAIKDLTIARDMGVNIVGSFHNDYKGGVKEFEEETGIMLPPDIAEMLGDVREKKEQPSIHVDNVSPDEKWTVERFNELLNSQEHSELYESRNQTESLSELGADLMNFVAKNQWELTYKFRERNFSFYFGRRLVFGINLHAQTSRLCVWVPEDDLIDVENDWINCGMMNHRHERYYSSSGCAVYPRGVEVADLKEMLAFAYAWWSGGLE